MSHRYVKPYVSIHEVAYYRADRERMGNTVERMVGAPHQRPRVKKKKIPAVDESSMSLVRHEP